MTAFQPAYLHSRRRNTLGRRAAAALARLERCDLCPRACGANRAADQRGRCQVGRRATVAAAAPHFGEERCLVGGAGAGGTGALARGGSGTIFFGGCSLGCVFCQNWEISHGGEGVEVSAGELAAAMLHLQELGCRNINLVTPSHVVAQILEALPLAVDGGLRLPLVYNTSGYDTVATLELLDGVVDIYMPDFKYWDPRAAERDLTAGDYPQRAREAIAEMHRQVGDLRLDADGVARHGLLVRHLVMPDGAAESDAIFTWLASLSAATFVNVMAQYRPQGLARTLAGAPPNLGRSLRGDEHRRALAAARAAGLHRAAAW